MDDEIIQEDSSLQRELRRVRDWLPLIWRKIQASLYLGRDACHVEHSICLMRSYHHCPAIGNERAWQSDAKRCQIIWLRYLVRLRFISAAMEYAYSRRYRLPKPRRPYSPVAVSAAEMLGLMIRSARLERNMTATELAERGGVSRPLLRRVENGDMGVSIGAVFEIAAILGVPLFEADEERLSMRLGHERRVAGFLRKRAYQAQLGTSDDDL